jgi:hypothetical protein
MTTQKTQTPSIADELLEGAGYETAPKADPSTQAQSNDNNSDDGEGNSTPTASENPNNPNKDSTNTVPNNQNEGATEKNNTDPQDGEIDEKSLINFLKKKGIEVDSLDQLKPKPADPSPEDLEKQREQSRQAAIQFGITSNLFTQKEYDDYAKFTAKDKQDAVKEHFIEQYQQSHPDVDYDDAEDVYNEKFFLLEDEEGYKYKSGQQDIEQYYERITKEKYGKIVGIEELHKKVTEGISKFNSYKTQVEDILTTKIPADLTFSVEGQDIKIPLGLQAETLNSLKDTYLTQDMMSSLVDQSGQVNTELLVEEIQKDLFWANRNTLIAEVARTAADKARLEAKGGRKGIVQPDTATSPNTQHSQPAGQKSLSDDMMGV